MERIFSKHWHHMPEDEILDLLNTDKTSGLDVFEIEHRRKRFGLNRLSDKGTMRSKATLLRAGKKMAIYCAELVPGDIVYLQSGDKVSADIRLLHIRDLQIKEAALTGEFLPVEKLAGKSGGISFLLQ